MSALTARELHHLQTVADHACDDTGCPCLQVSADWADTARLHSPDHVDDTALAKVLLRLSAGIADATEAHDLTGQHIAWYLIRTASHLAVLELKEPGHA